MIRNSISIKILRILLCFFLLSLNWLTPVQAQQNNSHQISVEIDQDNNSDSILKWAKQTHSNVLIDTTNLDTTSSLHQKKTIEIDHTNDLNTISDQYKLSSLTLNSNLTLLWPKPDIERIAHQIFEGKQVYILPDASNSGMAQRYTEEGKLFQDQLQAALTTYVTGLDSTNRNTEWLLRKRVDVLPTSLREMAIGVTQNYILQPALLTSWKSWLNDDPWLTGRLTVQLYPGGRRRVNGVSVPQPAVPMLTVNANMRDENNRQLHANISFAPVDQIQPNSIPTQP